MSDNPHHPERDDDLETELRQLFHRFHELEDERRANGYDVSEHSGTSEQRVVDHRLAVEQSSIEERIIDLQRRRQHAVAHTG